MVLNAQESFSRLVYVKLKEKTIAIIHIHLWLLSVSDLYVCGGCVDGVDGKVSSG